MILETITDGPTRDEMQGWMRLTRSIGEMEQQKQQVG